MIVQNKKYYNRNQTADSKTANQKKESKEIKN